MADGAGGAAIVAAGKDVLVEAIKSAKDIRVAKERQLTERQLVQAQKEAFIETIRSNRKVFEKHMDQTFEIRTKALGTYTEFIRVELEGQRDHAMIKMLLDTVHVVLGMDPLRGLNELVGPGTMNKVKQLEG